MFNNKKIKKLEKQISSLKEMIITLARSRDIILNNFEVVTAELHTKLNKNKLNDKLLALQSQIDKGVDSKINNIDAKTIALQNFLKLEYDKTTKSFKKSVPVKVMKEKTIKKTNTKK